MSNLILPLSNLQAKSLAGKRWTFNGRTYYFKSFDPAAPGQPPWKSGAEGKAFPLLDTSGQVAAYLKFFTTPSKVRLARTRWLVARHIHRWSPQLSAAPSAWLDTRRKGRPDGVDFDLTGCLATAALGETWLELKYRLYEKRAQLDKNLRWQCLCDLVAALAVLEQADIVHGDLSPGNILVNARPTAGGPALSVIDFDAFVAPPSKPRLVLPVSAGGTYGTAGYCPPELVRKAEAGDLTVAPYSDRHSRDMLLLELLLAGPDFPSEQPPFKWHPDKLQLRYRALLATAPPGFTDAIAHLQPPAVFCFTEPQRPSSSDLAKALGPIIHPPSTTAATQMAVMPEPATFALGQRWTNTLGMVFIGVPGVPAFSVWETRVADYAAYAAARSGVDESWENPGFTQTDQHPVVMVSWEDAQAFCEWLTEKERGEGKLGPNQSYRLPEDWEWSVAVGLIESRIGTPKDKDAQTPGVYPWGTQWPPPKGAGNYHPSLGVDSFDNTSPVGSFTANRFRLYDLGGNVWEWCKDWYDGAQSSRVLRGGSWYYYYPAYLLSSRRLDYTPVRRYNDLGFRCVLVGRSSPQVQAEVRPKPALAAVAPSAPTLVTGQRWTNTLGMVFAAVPGVPAFSVWETRVADYAAYAAARSGVDGGWKNPGFTQTDQHPVVMVSWEDAQAFCEWLTEKERGEGKLGPNQSYRLPEDWEWSVAVGLIESRIGTPKDKDAQTPGVYPWGTQWPPPKGAGNYHPSLGVDSFDNTSPVGSFTANRFRLYDLGGNVWEWCKDWYDRAQSRVLRGGSWHNINPVSLLSSRRYYYTPDYRLSDFGFRCVLVDGSSR